MRTRRGSRIAAGGSRSALVAIAVVWLGCAPIRSPNETPRYDGGGFGTRPTGADRPSLLVIPRDGDARSAIAVAVAADGIAPERGAVVGVSLAALVEERLAQRGLHVEAAGSWDGWTLRALVASPQDARAAVDAIRTALIAPVAPDDPILTSVRQKISALARRPLPDPALAAVARCTGEPYAPPRAEAPQGPELERWRSRAHSLRRIALAVAGNAAVVDEATRALERGPAWPRVATAADAPVAAAAGADIIVYDAAGELDPGQARFVSIAWTPEAERAVAAASILGEAHGALASRLATLDAPSRLRSIVATAHRQGGCVAVTIEFSARALVVDGAARIAAAVALARQETEIALAEVTARPELRREVALRASDPRDAAERAAWWSLSERASAYDIARRAHVVVGVAPSRDDPGSGADRARATDLQMEIDRATLAGQAPVVEATTRVERGQGEVWVLVASPCGTVDEAAADAGTSAVAAFSAAARAAAEYRDVRVEPVVAPDAMGVLVHGAPRVGESARAQALRLGDVAARAFGVAPLDPSITAQSRARLLRERSSGPALAFAAMARALSPGHPSWVDALGTPLGLASASDDALALRVSALRSGPVRVAVLADDDTAQADAAVRAVDRWITRRPGTARACAVPVTVDAPRTGVYAVDAPQGAAAQVWIIAPLPAHDDASRAGASWMAAALNGRDGLLARALGGTPPDGRDSASALAASARVLGYPRTPALVIHIIGPDDALDEAVAQTRALLDRLRRGALAREDLARAAGTIADQRLATLLDPRARALELWRGLAPAPAPSVDALRAFSALVLRDEALLLVAQRPAGATPAAGAFPARDTKGK